LSEIITFWSFLRGYSSLPQMTIVGVATELETIDLALMCLL